LDHFIDKVPLDGFVPLLSSCLHTPAFPFSLFDPSGQPRQFTVLVAEPILSLLHHKLSILQFLHHVNEPLAPPTFFLLFSVKMAG
jgi:hypothetical protein